VEEGLPISVGAIVRGNYSEVESRVEHAWTPKGETGWVIQGRQTDNKLSTLWYNFLGERKADKIQITDPRRPDDKILVLSEPKAKRVKPKQMELAL
jgi:hypothetical protein